MTYAIIKYYIHALGHSGAVWEKIADPSPELVPEFLTAKEAKQIIAENKMEVVYTYKDGKIYDFPDKRWTRKWKGIFEKRRLERNRKAKIKSRKKSKNKNYET